MRLSPFIKILSLLVSFIFTTNTICLSAPPVYTITVSKNVGKVTSRWKAPHNKQKIVGEGLCALPDQNMNNGRPQRGAPTHIDNRTVVLVQDAHMSFEAQKNLAEIICQLLPQLTLKSSTQSSVDNAALPTANCQLPTIPFIGIEGAIGEYDLKRLRDFPLGDIKERVGEEYVKEGKFIGAELASIIAARDFTLYGLEDEELFKKNFTAFYEVMQKRNQVLQFLASLETSLVPVKDEFNKKLSSFFNHMQQFEKQDESLDTFLEELFLHQEVLGIDLLGYATLARFKECAQKNDTDGLEKMCMAEVLRDTRKISHEISLRLAMTQKEKDCLSLLDRITTLKKLITLRALKEDVEAFRADREAYDLAKIAEAVNKITNTVREGLRALPNQDMGNGCPQRDTPTYDIMTIVNDFYQLAESRDEALLENLLDQMEKKKQNIGILVAGGYHTEGLAKLLRERTISYITIAPNITNVIEDVKYMDRLMGNIAPLNPLLASSLQVSRFNAGMRVLAGNDAFDTLIQDAGYQMHENVIIKDDGSFLRDFDRHTLVQQLMASGDNACVQIGEALEQVMEREGVADFIKQELDHGRPLQDILSEKNIGETIYDQKLFQKFVGDMQAELYGTHGSSTALKVHARRGTEDTEPIDSAYAVRLINDDSPTILDDNDLNRWNASHLSSTYQADANALIAGKGAVTLIAYVKQGYPVEVVHRTIVNGLREETTLFSLMYDVKEDEGKKRIYPYRLLNHADTKESFVLPLDTGGAMVIDQESDDPYRVWYVMPDGYCHLLRFDEDGFPLGNEETVFIGTIKGHSNPAHLEYAYKVLSACSPKLQSLLQKVLPFTPVFQQDRFEGIARPGKGGAVGNLLTIQYDEDDVATLTVHKDMPESLILSLKDGGALILQKDFDADWTVCRVTQDMITLHRFDENGNQYGFLNAERLYDLPRSNDYAYLFYLQKAWEACGDSVREAIEETFDACATHWFIDTTSIEDLYTSHGQTQNGRLNIVDDLLIRQNLIPRGGKVADMNASSGITSLNLVKRLEFSHAQVTSCDLMQKLCMVRKGKVRAVFDAYGKMYGCYLGNTFHADAYSLMHDDRTMREMRREYDRNNYVVFDRIDPRVRAYEKKHPQNLVCKEIDVFDDALRPEYDLVRSFNLVNHLFKSGESREEATWLTYHLITCLGRAVNEGGYLLIGDTTKEGDMYYALWRKRKNQLKRVRISDDTRSEYLKGFGDLSLDADEEKVLDVTGALMGDSEKNKNVLKRGDSALFLPEFEKRALSPLLTARLRPDEDAADWNCDEKQEKAQQPSPKKKKSQTARREEKRQAMRDKNASLIQTKETKKAVCDLLGISNEQFAAYIRNEVKFKPSREEERELIRLYQEENNGDAYLVLAAFCLRYTTGYVNSYAKAYPYLSPHKDQCISEGYVGALRALYDYDVSKGAKLWTYTLYQVRASVERYMKNNMRTVRVPVNKENDLRNLRKFEDAFSEENGYFPHTYDELASFDPAFSKQFSSKQYENLRSLKTQSTISLDQKGGREDDDRTIADQLGTKTEGVLTHGSEEQERVDCARSIIQAEKEINDYCAKKKKKYNNFKEEENAFLMKQYVIPRLLSTKERYVLSGGEMRDRFEKKFGVRLGRNSIYNFKEKNQKYLDKLVRKYHGVSKKDLEKRQLDELQRNFRKQAQARKNKKEAAGTKKSEAVILDQAFMHVLNDEDLKKRAPFHDRNVRILALSIGYSIEEKSMCERVPLDVLAKMYTTKEKEPLSESYVRDIVSKYKEHLKEAINVIRDDKDDGDYDVESPGVYCGPPPGVEISGKQNNTVLFEEKQNKLIRNDFTRAIAERVIRHDLDEKYRRKKGYDKADSKKYGYVVRPFLTRKEERALLDLYHDENNGYALDELVRRNELNVQKALARAKTRYFFLKSDEDLLQEGRNGLMYGIFLFDRKRTNRIISYAKDWIRVYIEKYGIANRSDIKWPAHLPRILKTYDAVEEECVEAFGYMPTSYDEYVALMGAQGKEPQINKEMFYNVRDIFREQDGISLDQDHDETIVKIKEELAEEPDAYDIAWEKELPFDALPEQSKHDRLAQLDQHLQAWLRDELFIEEWQRDAFILRTFIIANLEDTKLTMGELTEHVRDEFQTAITRSRVDQLIKFYTGKRIYRLSLLKILKDIGIMQEEQEMLDSYIAQETTEALAPYVHMLQWFETESLVVYDQLGAVMIPTWISDLSQAVKKDALELLFYELYMLFKNGGEPGAQWQKDATIMSMYAFACIEEREDKKKIPFKIVSPLLKAEAYDMITSSNPKAIKKKALQMMRQIIRDAHMPLDDLESDYALIMRWFRICAKKRIEKAKSQMKESKNIAEADVDVDTAIKQWFRQGAVFAVKGSDLESYAQKNFNPDVITAEELISLSCDTIIEAAEKGETAYKQRMRTFLEEYFAHPPTKDAFLKNLRTLYRSIHLPEYANDMLKRQYVIGLTNDQTNAFLNGKALGHCGTYSGYAHPSIYVHMLALQYARVAHNEDGLATMLRHEHWHLVRITNLAYTNYIHSGFFPDPDTPEHYYESEEQYEDIRAFWHEVKAFASRVWGSEDPLSFLLDEEAYKTKEPAPLRVTFDIPESYEEKIEQTARVLLPYSHLLTAINILLRAPEAQEIKKIHIEFQAKHKQMYLDENNMLHIELPYQRDIRIEEYLSLFEAALGYNLDAAIYDLERQLPHLLLHEDDFDAINVVMHGRLAGMGDMVFVCNAGQVLARAFPKKKVRVIFHSENDFKLACQTKLLKGLDEKKNLQTVEGLEVLNAEGLGEEFYGKEEERFGLENRRWFKAQNSVIGEKDVTLFYALGGDGKEVMNSLSAFKLYSGKARYFIPIFEVGFYSKLKNPLAEGYAHLGFGEHEIGMPPVSPVSKDIYEKKYPRSPRKIKRTRRQILKKLPGWKVLDYMMPQNNLEKTINSEWGFLYTHEARSVRKYFSIFEEARTFDPEFGAGDKTFFLMCSKVDTGVHEEIRSLAEKNDYTLLEFNDEVKELQVTHEAQRKQITVIVDYSLPRKLFNELMLHSDDLPTYITGQDNLANILYLNYLSSGRPFFWEVLVFQGTAKHELMRVVEKELGKKEAGFLRNLWEDKTITEDQMKMFATPRPYRVFFKRIAEALNKHRSFTPQIYYLMLQEIKKRNYAVSGRAESLIARKEELTIPKIEGTVLYEKEFRDIFSEEERDKYSREYWETFFTKVHDDVYDVLEEHGFNQFSLRQFLVCAADAMLENAFFDILEHITHEGTAFNPYVAVTLTYDGAQFILEVKDNGRGIAKSRLGQIGKRKLASGQKQRKSKTYGFRSGGKGVALLYETAALGDAYGGHLEIYTNRKGEQRSVRIEYEKEHEPLPYLRDEIGTTVREFVPYVIKAEGKMPRGDNDVLNMLREFIQSRGLVGANAISLLHTACTKIQKLTRSDFFSAFSLIVGMVDDTVIEEKALEQALTNAVKMFSMSVTNLNGSMYPGADMSMSMPSKSLVSMIDITNFINETLPEVDKAVRALLTHCVYFRISQRTLQGEDINAVINEYKTYVKKDYTHILKNMPGLKEIYLADGGFVRNEAASVAIALLNEYLSSSDVDNLVSDVVLPEPYELSTKLSEYTLEDISHAASMTGKLACIKVLGRTLIFEDENQDLLCVKMRKKEETREEFANEIRSLLWAHQEHIDDVLLSGIPKPIAVHGDYEFIFDIHSLASTIKNTVERKRREAFHDATEKGHSFAIHEIPSAIAFKIQKNDRTYASYIYDNDQKKSVRSAFVSSAIDLAKLLKKGMIHTSLLSLFHNVTGDGVARRYYWSVEMLGVETGAGRVTGWRNACFWPNIGMHGEIRDWADIYSLDEILNNELFDEFVNYQFQAYDDNETGKRAVLLYHFLGEYAFSLVTLYGDWLLRHDQMPQWTDDAAIGHIADFIKDMYCHMIAEYTGDSYSTVSEQYASIIDWMAFARQVVYWMSDAYIADVDPAKNNRAETFPKNIFGEDVHVTFGDFRPDTFDTVHGFKGDQNEASQNHNAPALGPVNGPYPIYALINANYYLFALAFIKRVEKLHEMKSEMDHMQKPAATITGTMRTGLSGCALGMMGVMMWILDAMKIVPFTSTLIPWLGAIGTYLTFSGLLNVVIAESGVAALYDENRKYVPENGEVLAMPGDVWYAPHWNVAFKSLEKGVLWIHEALHHVWGLSGTNKWQHTIIYSMQLCLGPLTGVCGIIYRKYAKAKRIAGIRQMINHKENYISTLERDLSRMRYMVAHLSVVIDKEDMGSGESAYAALEMEELCSERIDHVIKALYTTVEDLSFLNFWKIRKYRKKLFRLRTKLSTIYEQHKKAFNTTRILDTYNAIRGLLIYIDTTLVWIERFVRQRDRAVSPLSLTDMMCHIMDRFYKLQVSAYVLSRTLDPVILSADRVGLEIALGKFILWAKKYNAIPHVYFRYENDESGILSIRIPSLGVTEKQKAALQRMLQKNSRGRQNFFKFNSALSDGDTDLDMALAWEILHDQGMTVEGVYDPEIQGVRFDIRIPQERIITDARKKQTTHEPVHSVIDTQAPRATVGGMLATSLLSCTIGIGLLMYWLFDSADSIALSGCYLVICGFLCASLASQAEERLRSNGPGIIAEPGERWYQPRWHVPLSTFQKGVVWPHEVLHAIPGFGTETFVIHTLIYIIQLLLTPISGCVGVSIGMGMMAYRGACALRPMRNIKENDGAQFKEGSERIYSLLTNQRKMKKVIELATSLRKEYPCASFHLHGLEGPLGYAVREGIYEHIEKDIYITPVNESFRRHIIFRMNKNKEILSVVEIKIPGERKMRKAITEKEFDSACDIARQYPSAMVQPCFMCEMAYGTYHLYGKEEPFDKGCPLRFIAYAYTDGRRLLHVGLEGFQHVIDKAPELYSGDVKEMEKDIVIQIAQKLAHIHASGYRGFYEEITETGMSEFSDLHAENIRIVKEGDHVRIFFIGDTGDYRRFDEGTVKQVSSQSKAALRMKDLEFLYFGPEGSMKTGGLKEIIKSYFFPPLYGIYKQTYTETYEQLMGTMPFVKKNPQGNFEKNNPELYRLLTNPAKMKKILKQASELRMQYPYRIQSEGLEGPLAYAIRNGFYEHIEQDIYMTPITESFRRHIIFRMTSNKEVIAVVEIKIPGEEEGRTIIRREDFDIACTISNQYPEAMVQPLLFCTMPLGSYLLYNDLFTFTEEQPLNFIVYAYQDGRRLRNITKDGDKNNNKALLEMLARHPSLYGGDIQKFKEDIARQVAQCVAAIHKSGYKAFRMITADNRSGDNTDLHTENFRICFEDSHVKIFLVGDTFAFSPLCDFSDKLSRDEQSEEMQRIRFREIEVLCLGETIEEKTAEEETTEKKTTWASLKKILDTHNDMSWYKIFLEAYHRAYSGIAEEPVESTSIQPITNAGDQLDAALVYKIYNDTNRSYFKRAEKIIKNGSVLLVLPDSGLSPSERSLIKKHARIMLGTNVSFMNASLFKEKAETIDDAQYVLYIGLSPDDIKGIDSTLKEKIDVATVIGPNSRAITVCVRYFYVILNALLTEAYTARLEKSSEMVILNIKNTLFGMNINEVTRQYAELIDATRDEMNIERQIKKSA